MINSKRIWSLLILVIPSLACLVGNGPGTVIPAGRPEDFEIQVATATTDPRFITVEPTNVQEETIIVRGLGDAPTHTPDPNAPTATATRVIIPSRTPTAATTGALTTTLALTTTSELTATTKITQTATVTAEVAALAPALPATEPDPPRQGGDWDFEADYIPWGNPFGEPCPGASVASGWTAFVEDGQFGSSCLNENLYQPNVFSGGKSQEITFDFIAANSGIYRTIETQGGHRYNIVAYAKHDRSLSPVEMSLGIDLSGGGDWTADTVQWFPWDDGAEDTWVPTEETVTATGDLMTIFIKGFHPLGEQGGKTVIDNVSVIDLGP